MTRLLQLSMLAVVFVSFPVGRVLAHHAFSPVYDEKKVITVEGVVTEFRFVNPHAMMFMEVTDKTGKVAKWTVEFAGRLNLAEGGWTAQSIKPGERVTVTGNPARKTEHLVFFRKIVRPDGSELLPAGAQRLNAIEEARRERAKQRTQSSQSSQTK